jgi:hypothetical protein
MPQSVRKYFFILACLLPVLNAAAEDQCASKSDDWACFSKLEIQAGAAAPMWRLVVFPNLEVLAEKEQSGATKKYLALPSGVQLYFGLSGDESVAPGGKNPFALVDVGFALPVTALRTAFPPGPLSVPNGKTKKNIVVEGKPISVTTTRRRGQQKIEYKLEAAAIRATGVWERAIQNPLPGSFSLVGWISPTGAQFATLDAARAAQMPQP